jgi:hypothetical protein
MIEKRMSRKDGGTSGFFAAKDQVGDEVDLAAGFWSFCPDNVVL